MALAEKTQFKNMTDGWIGAVVVSPRGDPGGLPIEPGGTIWLTEEEQALTANAPRDAAHNPFIEQVFIVLDENGARVEQKVVPLVQISEDRWVPSNARPIPADGGLPDPAPTPSTPEATPEPPAVPQGAQAGSQGPGGSPEPPSVPPAPSAPLPPGANPDLTPPADEGRVSEETAAQSPGPASEETGAAVPPTGDAVAGSFAPGEEVGTPEAPAQTAPPPYAPGG